MVLMTFTVTTKDVLALEGEEADVVFEDIFRAVGEESYDDEEAENGESEELAQPTDEESSQNLYVQSRRSPLEFRLFKRDSRLVKRDLRPSQKRFLTPR